MTLGQCNEFGVQRVEFRTGQLGLSRTGEIGMELEILEIALHPPNASARMAPKAPPATQAQPSQASASPVSVRSRAARPPELSQLPVQSQRRQRKQMILPSA